MPLRRLDDVELIDLVVDGADEIDARLNLIKGGGAALLQEKIVAAASARMVVIADDSKRVAHLGRFPLPVEIVRFGWTATRRAGRASSSPPWTWTATRSTCAWARTGRSSPTRATTSSTCTSAASATRRALATALNALPGVVEHGLFIDMAQCAVLGRADGTARGPLPAGRARRRPARHRRAHAQPGRLRPCRTGLRLRPLRHRRRLRRRARRAHRRRARRPGRRSPRSTATAAPA